ncbi:hypothetical protein [Glutamicibacter creatinolyticus]|uniref:hypothetical protein n=1 Tax=Glutamicibacter creatinolyticus TaxID=162496 RepID=UPI0031DEDCBA
MEHHRYVDLLELIDQLPQACRFNEAVAQDEEAAEIILDMEEQSDEEKEPWAPRLSEFSLTNALLVSLINEIKSLRMSGQSLAGVKPKKEEPFPGPRTALEAARLRRDIEDAIQIACLFGFSPEDFN